METWITDNWQMLSGLVTAATALVVAVVYALNQMTRQITALTGSMVREVKSALGTANADRKLEVAVFEQYLQDSRETRRALTDAQVEMRTLQATVRSQADEMAALKLNMAQRRNEADEALLALQQARTVAEATQRDHDAQRGALMQQVAELTDEVNRLKGRVQSLEDAGRAKQAALDTMAGERDTLRDVVAALETENARLLAENIDLRQQVALIRSELETIKQKLEAKNNGDETTDSHDDGHGGAGGAADGGNAGAGTGGGDGGGDAG